MQGERSPDVAVVGLQAPLSFLNADNFRADEGSPYDDIVQNCAVEPLMPVWRWYAFGQALGDAIRAWRQRAGLTQEGLAQALSVTFSTVSRWENGHVLPSKLAWRALQQLADERGCPIDPNSISST